MCPAPICTGSAGTWLVSRWNSLRCLQKNASVEKNEVDWFGTCKWPACENNHLISLQLNTAASSWKSCGFYPMEINSLFLILLEISIEHLLVVSIKGPCFCCLTPLWSPWLCSAVKRGDPWTLVIHNVSHLLVVLNTFLLLMVCLKWVCFLMYWAVYAIGSQLRHSATNRPSHST